MNKKEQELRIILSEILVDTKIGNVEIGDTNGEKSSARIEINDTCLAIGMEGCEKLRWLQTYGDGTGTFTIKNYLITFRLKLEKEYLVTNESIDDITMYETHQKPSEEEAIEEAKRSFKKEVDAILEDDDNWNVLEVENE